ncbi:MAG: zf-TFIIB domain-containing protein [Pseudomonadota bacterium]
MPCPVCKVPLVMSERQGVEIDYCPQCRGIWLDRGELDKILERSAREAAPVPASSAHSSPAYTAPPPAAYAPPAGGPRYEQPAQGYDQAYGHGHRGHGGYNPRKRKKSFLEELFD